MILVQLKYVKGTEWQLNARSKLYLLNIVLILEMVLSADQVFEKIGSFGRYQLFILVLFNIIEWLWFGWPMLLMTFIAPEPAWRCNSNSTECPLIGTVRPGHKNYTFRCDLPRNSWEFEDDFTSVVTQASIEQLTSSWWWKRTVFIVVKPWMPMISTSLNGCEGYQNQGSSVKRCH